MPENFDYLFLEPLLIEHIRAEVTGLQDVSGLPDLQMVAEQQQNTPAVYVIYLGDEVGSNAAAQAGDKKVQTVKQNWALVLTVHSADANGDGEEARREAGPLLGKLLLAVTGFKAAPDVSPLSRHPRQVPVVYENGYFYYPLVFSTQFVFPRIRTWQPPTPP